MLSDLLGLVRIRQVQKGVQRTREGLVLRWLGTRPHRRPKVLRYPRPGRQEDRICPYFEEINACAKLTFLALEKRIKTDCLRFFSQEMPLKWRLRVYGISRFRCFPKNSR